MPPPPLAVRFHLAKTALAKDCDATRLRSSQSRFLSPALRISRRSPEATAGVWPPLACQSLGALTLSTLRTTSGKRGANDDPRERFCSAPAVKKEVLSEANTWGSHFFTAPVLQNILTPGLGQRHARKYLAANGSPSRVTATNRSAERVSPEKMASVPRRPMPHVAPSASPGPNIAPAEKRMAPARTLGSGSQEIRVFKDKKSQLVMRVPHKSPGGQVCGGRSRQPRRRICRARGSAKQNAFTPGMALIEYRG